MSAVQRALHIPEVLDAIVEQVHRTGDDDDRDQQVLNCGLTCKRWFDAAVGVLWRSPTERDILDSELGTTFCHLPFLLSKVDPARRQFYASAVESCNLITDNRALHYDYTIEGITFPKLQAITIFLDHGRHVSPLAGHRVRRIALDPSYEPEPASFGVSADDLDAILGDIVVSLPARPRPTSQSSQILTVPSHQEAFPETEEIEFVDTCQVHAGSLEVFAERLPKLRTFDHSMAVKLSS